MTKKKYINNVDANKRHHYDVYEITFGGTAVHIAPFTQEMEAFRVAEALAALDVLDEGVEHSTYLVRSRPSAAHTIHRKNARSVKRTYESISLARKRLMAMLDDTSDDRYWEDAPTETSAGNDDPESIAVTKATKDDWKDVTPKKKRSVLKRKPKVGAK